MRCPAAWPCMRRFSTSTISSSTPVCAGGTPVTAHCTPRIRSSTNRCGPSTSSPIRPRLRPPGVGKRSAHQYFSIEGDVLARYEMFDEPITLSVDWIRLGSHVVEIGENLTCSLISDANWPRPISNFWKPGGFSRSRRPSNEWLATCTTLSCNGSWPSGWVYVSPSTHSISRQESALCRKSAENLEEAIAELRFDVDALASNPEPVRSTD